MTAVGAPLGAFVPGVEVTVEPTGSGPLDGVRVAVKDVFDIAGAATGFGNPTWLASHAPAERTAPAVERLLAAGGRVVGKTVTDELTYSLTGENVHYGTPVNPRCPRLVPGGSSSGSASAVAGGPADLGLGTDCGGSVRIPSSFCGLYGMRPTHGRIPLDGVCPFAPSFDTVGWMARDADLLVRAGQVLLGAGPAAESQGDDEAPPLRRALLARDAFALVGTEVGDALEEPLRRVEGLVDSVEETSVSEEGLERWLECFRTIQAYEIWQSLGAWVEDANPTLGPGIRERFEWASTVPDEDVATERRFREGVSSRLEALLGAGDVLCLPTAPGIAPRRGAPTDEVEIGFRNRALTLLCIAGLGGLPQVSMPLAELEGCPLGLSLVGRRGSDLALLCVAGQLAASSDGAG